MSALPTHHLVDPDRGEGRGAAFGDRIVAIDAPSSSPIAMARLRCLGKWMPIPARQKFIVHCTSGAAAPISFSMRSRSAGRSSPSGLFATRPDVRLHPARAAQRSSVGHPFLAKGLFVGMFLDDIGVEPVGHLRKVGGPHHPLHLGPTGLWLDQEDRQEPGVDVLRSPRERWPARGWS